MAFEYPSKITDRKKKKQAIQQAEAAAEAAKIEKVAKKADKNFKKLAESKETQLHSKDAMEGFDRAEKRASSEAMQDYKKMAKGGRVNTRRENRLEELGRVDSEKAYTRKGKRNLRAEKKRIVREVSSRGAAKRGHGKEIK